MRHTISVLVENEFGVLARVAGMFSGRGFNIESLAVAETMDPTVSCITLVTAGDDTVLEQITKQLNKLVPVIRVSDFKDTAHVERELVLIKVKADERTRGELMHIVDIFRGKIIDVGPQSHVVEVTGQQDKIAAIIELLKPVGITEIVRTGRVAMLRGTRTLTALADDEKEKVGVNVFTEKDADLGNLKGKKVAVIGYGSQGHAHALNLRDSGIDVVVGLRKDSASWKKAESAGLKVLPTAEAAAWGDVVMILVPDELAGEMYLAEIAPGMKAGKFLAFGHGFNIHFKKIVPPADVNVFMIAPKGPGHLVRSEYERGRGVPCLLAVHQDPSGTTQKVGLAYGKAIGGARAAIIETNFREETETDLFGEQAVLCGGLTELIRAGYETLVEAGYAPEMAYFECMHEVKLIVDLLYEGGIANMRYSISNTAEYGDMTRGKRVIGPEARAAMKQILADIQSGKFADEWITEYQCGMPHFRELRKEAEHHSIEKVGATLRGLMPWLASNRLVDKTKN